MVYIWATYIAGVFFHMDPQNSKILVEGVEVGFFWERFLCDCFLLARCEVNGKGLVSKSHRYGQATRFWQLCAGMAIGGASALRAYGKAHVWPEFVCWATSPWDFFLCFFSAFDFFFWKILRQN